MANKIVQLKSGDDNIFPKLSTQYKTADITSDAGNFKVTKYGNICYLNPNGALSATSTWTIVATLAEEYRPAFDVPYRTWISQDDVSKRLLIQVQKSGGIRIRSIGSASFSNVWFNDTTMWPTPV